MGTRMIRDRSRDGGWWLMVGLFTLCVVGWSLVFSCKAGAVEAPLSSQLDADRVWQVSDFDRISISGSPTVQLVQGDAEGVYGRGDGEDLDRLQIVVEGRELVIRPKPGIKFGRWLRDWSGNEVNLVVEFRELAHLKLSGSGELTADGLAAKDLSLRVSGSGEIDLDELAVDRLNLAISGSADVGLSGAVEDQTVKISGSADYAATNLTSVSARVRISGSADALISVSDSLDAKVSGSGSVRYAGSPAVSQRISGSGEVQPF